MAKVKKNRNRELVHIKLSEIFLRESSNPLFEGVTISRVDVSPDMAMATVFFAAYLSKKSVHTISEGLNKSSGFFQAKLGRALSTRNTPRLTFVYDEGFDRADRIDRLIHEDPTSFPHTDSESSEDSTDLPKIDSDSSEDSTNLPKTDPESPTES